MVQLGPFRAVSSTNRPNFRANINLSQPSLPQRLFDVDMDNMQCDPNVANLPLSDPRCVKAVECCTAFYAGENASQEATPWAGQFVYGHWTTYYWVAVVGLLMIWHTVHLIRDRRSVPADTHPSSGGPTAFDRTVAAGRFFTYRSLERYGRYSLISMPRAGLLVFFVVTIVFLLALVFAERPYYRPQLGFGSPPIAIRTGLMAFACVPILVALAGKANIITMLTGISYEKLNVVHQWVSWMSFALSLIHAIPFFVASVQDKGDGGYARVVSEFYRYGNGAMTECSGVPPLAMLFGLCVFSFPQIRRRFYESFYFLHIALAITYLGLLFWHAGDAEDSWVYLWATLAVWLATWVARLFWFMRSTNIRSNWFSGASAKLELRASGLVRIEIERPADFQTKPGQHALLRFLSLSPLDNHPFTIASAPTAASGAGPSAMESGKGPDTILFLSKVHEGFTRTLATHCLANGGEATTTVILDGPYGGLVRPHIERRYDSLLLIAGGSGISSSLSWLHHAACAPSTSMLQTVTLVWAVRDAESFGWAYRDLELATRLASSGVDVKLCFFVTGAAVEMTPLSASAKRKEYSGIDGAEEPRPWTERIQALGQLTSGRPDLRTMVEDAIMPSKRLIVFACGPHGMNHDIANICSAVQKRVLSGHTKEVALHVETFGW